MTRYDPAGTECSHGEQPGARALMNLLVDLFPGSSDAPGIYNCRPVRNGSTLSFHGEGRALDILAASSEQQQMIADTAVSNTELWQVQEVIDYGRNRRWDSRRGWGYYGNTRGEKHVHITVNWDGARRTTQPIPGQPKPKGQKQMAVLLQEDPAGSVFLDTGYSVYEVTNAQDVEDAKNKGVPLFHIKKGSIRQTGQNT